MKLKPNIKKCTRGGHHAPSSTVADDRFLNETHALLVPAQNYRQNNFNNSRTIYCNDMKIGIEFEKFMIYLW